MDKFEIVIATKFDMSFEGSFKSFFAISRDFSFGRTRLRTLAKLLLFSGKILLSKTAFKQEYKTYKIKKGLKKYIDMNNYFYVKLRNKTLFIFPAKEIIMEIYKSWDDKLEYLYSIQNIAAKKGLAPEVIFLDKETKTVIQKFGGFCIKPYNLRSRIKKVEKALFGFYSLFPKLDRAAYEQSQMIFEGIKEFDDKRVTELNLRVSNLIEQINFRVSNEINSLNLGTERLQIVQAHGDLQPANILDYHGEIRFIDFERSYTKHYLYDLICLVTSSRYRTSKLYSKRTLKDVRHLINTEFRKNKLSYSISMYQTFVYLLEEYHFWLDNLKYSPDDSIRFLEWFKDLTF